MKNNNKPKSWLENAEEGLLVIKMLIPIEHDHKKNFNAKIVYNIQDLTGISLSAIT